MNGTTAKAYTVTTQLRVHVEPIEASEVPAVAREILAAAPRNLSNVDPQLANWMIRIESKLDCLLATMGLPQDSSALAEAPIDIDLSEDGLSFRGAGTHAAGAWVRIELDLPGPPLYRLTCIARAVETDGASTYFAFEVVREEDRRVILAHTLEVQRRELRLRSGMAGAPA